MTSRGLICWEGPSELDGAPIVVIATRQKVAELSNSKTGDVWQTWIMLASKSPLEALRSRDDASICGDCKLRPQGPFGTNMMRACYVNPGMIENVWQAWRRGTYAPARKKPFAGEMVRLGAYGDPASVPIGVWNRLLAGARGWIGYTHVWRDCDRAYQRLCMASVDNPAELALARAFGWRTFRTRFKDEEISAREIACPAAPEGGKRTTCDRCRLCDGIQYPIDRRRDVTVIVHGWKNATGAYAAVRGRPSKHNLRVLQSRFDFQR